MSPIERTTNSIRCFSSALRPAVHRLRSVVRQGLVAWSEPHTPRPVILRFTQDDNGYLTDYSYSAKERLSGRGRCRSRSSAVTFFSCHSSAGLTALPGMTANLNRQDASAKEPDVAVAIQTAAECDSLVANPTGLAMLYSGDARSPRVAICLVLPLATEAASVESRLCPRSFALTGTIE